MALGHKTGGGSRKGVPNRITSDLKGAIMHAFEEVGGASYLASVAKSHPQVFCTLLGKILPTQVTGKDGDDLTLENLVRASYRNVESV